MPLGTKHGLQPVPSIVLSVTLFVLLDLALLFLNFHIAHQIDEDSLAINLAGRERMLSQRIAKNIFELERTPMNSSRWHAQLEVLQESRALFGDTLNAFQFGGTVQGSDGEPALLRARIDPELRPILAEAAALWASYQDSLDLFLASNQAPIPAVASSDDLLTLVNELTTVLEHQAREKAGLLRRFQAAAVIFVLINFAIIVMQMRRRFFRVADNYVSLQNLVDKMSAAVLLVDDADVIKYANRSAELLFRFPEHQLVGKSQDILLIESDQVLLGRRADGSQFDVQMETGELVFSGSRVRVVTLNDITEHQESQARWRHLAHHDPLTGLPNRLLFEQRVQQEFSAASRHDEVVALLTIDLDTFKVINDVHGHLVGDEVLRQTAQRFRQCVRAEDLVARLGGDEFVVVLTRLVPGESAQKIAQTVCGFLLEAMTQPINFGDVMIKIKGSIGVSFYPNDGEFLLDVMQHSDAAMYRAKVKGVGCEIIGIA